MRKCFYGKHPTKRDLKAHHNFMMLVKQGTCEMKKQILFTDNEIKALRLVVSADYKIYVDRMGHAASHGQEYVDNYGEALGRILDKLND